MKFTNKFAFKSQGTWIFNAHRTWTIEMSRRILTLVDAFSQKAFIIMSIGKCIFKLQFKARCPDFHVELLLLHSPLLKESCLVSHPPLTYMLKFSGFSCLTSGQKEETHRSALNKSTTFAKQPKRTEYQCYFFAAAKGWCTKCVKGPSTLAHAHSTPRCGRAVFKTWHWFKHACRNVPKT